MLENTILGNDDPESVRVSALRTSGGKMSGDIEMCGNTITGLRTPANDTDAATKGYVQSAAAPAGYGLGENSGRQPYTADLNEITTIGFWAMPGGNAVNPGQDFIFWLRLFACGKTNRQDYPNCKV